MNFKEKVVDYLSKNNVEVERVEQNGEVESIICHIPKDANDVVDGIKTKMEEELNVAVLRTDNYGMNVVIVEANDLE